MNPIITRLAFLLGLFLAGLSVGWVTRGWKAESAEKAVSDANLAYALESAKLVQQKEIEHDTNQGIIDSLSVAARGRVRIIFPKCADAKNSNKNGEARAFPDRVDESFGRFQERVGDVMKRCDQLNIDAIRANK